jgi:hypothetical protein
MKEYNEQEPTEADAKEIEKIMEEEEEDEPEEE